MRFTTPLLLLLGTASALVATPRNTPGKSSTITLSNLPPTSDTSFWTPFPLHATLKASLRSSLSLGSDSSKKNTIPAEVRYEVVYHCETSTGSPIFAHVGNVISQIDTDPYAHTCRQRNPFGNHCTLIKKYATAAADICGPFWWGFEDCTGVPELYLTLWNRCAKNYGTVTRVGGFFRVVFNGDQSTKMDMNIYHT